MAATIPEPQGERMNFALSGNGGVANSSSNYSDGTYNFTASGTNNGVRSGAGWGQGEGWNSSTNTLPQWVQIDFNGSKTIDEIDVFTPQDNWQNPSEPTQSMTFALYGVTGFEAQYWNGSAWATVPGGSVAGNNKIWKSISFSAVTTSKIRVLTNGSPDGYTRVTEVEAWGPVVRTNVALAVNGGVASSSSNYSDGTYNFTASGTNNGVRSGAGWGQGEGWNSSTNTLPQWLQIDFNGSKTIGEIDVFTPQDNWQNPSQPTEAMTFSLYGLTAFDVQYWNGSSWATVPGGSVAGNNKIWKKFTFSPIATNKIRVVVNGSPDGYSRMTEIEAWDTPATGSGSSPSDFAMARLDPHNRTGTGGVDLLSNNFNWSLPLVNLPGRNLDLGLTLSYNSLVWTRSANYVDFDLDQGSVAPGFRLGFPTIEGPYFNPQANANFYMLMTPAGGRVELRQTSSGSATYESKDSSYLQLTDNLNGTMTLRPMDGSQLRFETVGGGWRCTRITDRNGNYITVSYRSWGEIDQVTDTLGRVLTFNYDNNWNIQSITQTWAGQQQPHEWATFGWGTATIASNLFPGLNNFGPNNTTIPVLTQVGLPDGSSYDFYYNSYGQVSTLARSASDGLHHSYTVYDYNSPGDDCPRVTQTRAWATNWSDQQGVPHEVGAQFTHDTDGGCRMTMPDGTVYKEYYAGSADFQSAPAWQNGLVLATKSFANATGADSNSWKKLTTTQWTQDNISASYLTNPRVTQTDISDVEGNHRRTTIDYGSSSLGYVQWGLPYIVSEYGVNGTTAIEFRHTQTDYHLSQSYLNQRIIGLVSSSQLYDATAAQWQTKVTYGYDDPAKITSQASTATQHDSVNYPDSFTTRGNVTSVSHWDVTDINNSSKALTSTISYNAAGSAISSTDPAGHTSGINYADSFSDNQNHNAFAYPTTLTDADGFSSAVQYKFELGAKTRVQTPLPNVITNQPGPVQTFAYDNAGRLQQVTSLTNGAYTRYDYGADYVQSFSTVNNVADEAFTFQLLNGNGQVFISGGNHPGSSGGYRAQVTYYGSMSRVMKQSKPTEINGSWVPAGDDVYNAQADTGGWRYTEQTYDWKGRTAQTTHPDGTYTSASYSGCGCAGGEVVTLTDEMSRRQKVYSDVLGRTWKTEVLNWDGSVYSTTTTSLNARDQATLTRQYAGTDQSATYQDTTLAFDGYGRLKTKHVPEQQADPNQPGSTDHTTWDYNIDDTLHQVTDARGASATYTYNNRKLVTDVGYSTPNSVQSAPNLHFSYDSSGNRTFLIDGEGTQAYIYDQVSRPVSETRTFTGLGAFTLSYDYNLAGELKRITDASNSTINYSYDASGRVNGITGSDNLVGGVAVYASSFAFRAWGGLKTMTDGSSHTSSVIYNSRLQPTQYDLSGNILHQNYDYYNDGRLSFVHDLPDDNFDRSYFYDHVGRLTQNRTGGDARGDTDPSPYYETFGYDAFSNLNDRQSFAWTDYFHDTDSASYINNRRSGWGYDADGRNTNIGTRTSSFDSLGQEISLSARAVPPSGVAYTVTQARTYDGDGLQLKELDSQSNDPSHPTTKYFLRSTVLAGAIVEELDVNGQKATGYVYTPSGKEIARQSPGIQNWVVTFIHPTPSGTSQFDTYSNSSSINQREFDPLGADVSLTRPLGPPPNEQPGDIGGSQLGGGIMDQRWSDFFNLDSGCMINGMAASCSTAMGIVSSGAGVIGPANTTHWDPDANNGAGGYQFFHAYADGTEGWGPLSGISGVTAPMPPRRSDPPMLKPRDPNRPFDPNLEIHLNASADYLFSSLPQTKGFDEARLRKALDDCLGSLFGLRLLSFSASGYGSNGFAEVKYRDPSVPMPSFTVVNEVSMYSAAQIKALAGGDPAAGFEAAGIVQAGRRGQHTLIQFDPHTNYTASDAGRFSGVGLTGLSRIIGNFLTAQIHELGNSVADITNDPVGQPSPPKGWRGQWDPDDGHQLESCVKNAYVNQ
ncbi:MAG TPA: hypothetical protein VN696_08905 [Pyrinomonadaceae bacterium]|nr:hypothetical protein [Pyrinomonadaceae bacterium]